MSSRNAILASLRSAQRTPATLPDVPMFDAGLPPALEKFKETFASMGGIWADRSADGDLEAQIRARFPDAKVICSAVPEVAGTRRIEQVRDPHELNDVDVGIVRPLFAVAETGSIWLSEAQYQVNALGYLSQHLVALLDPADIVGNLHHAYHRSDFFAANYAVLMSGPSATADIEGVLIRGAQGIRSLTVIPVARGAG
ncbi:LUD domain-containing protein [Paraburkholderia madseniana]|jgi:L-lactate dehydrogenase complex protein LldG|uniref:LUD domain-containing protein n=1 Tax=Paraburkholderia madseniana TaxID=2599607 RepID=A0AAP5BHW7_9BURK|nr:MULTISPECIES: LUD domain-containing protein [Paraburkholderia]MCX4148837.1 LUD domain-containing protein [Paraburkholderia madseniana]MDN7151775.1 LUD domain-containing protein [Paraburkholderia sp. WS6]MDQ6410655.1 LUD domain-containing protein [Paraburkholderia madseniana]